MTQPNDIEALATARKICAEVEGESKGYQYLSGERDDYPMMVAVLTALRAQDAVPVAGITMLRDTFKMWLEKGPNHQPRYPNGLRPWGTGDLKWFVEELSRFTHPSPNPAPAVAADGAILRDALFQIDNLDAAEISTQAAWVKELVREVLTRPTATNGDKDAKEIGNAN